MREKSSDLLAYGVFVCYNISCVTAPRVLCGKTQKTPDLRYAMKRKVADGRSGNFRGVCPILNRATVIPTLCCANASCDGFPCRNARKWGLLRSTIQLAITVSERQRFFGIFYEKSGNTRKRCKGVSGGGRQNGIQCPPTTYLARGGESKWQSMKKSESKSRATSMR